MRNTDRISESELGVPALRAMTARPGGFISTSDLIGELFNLFRPTGKDAETIPGRKDTYFSQKVRNLVSHQNAPGNIIAEGYAEHIADEDGLRITEAGREYLKRSD